MTAYKYFIAQRHLFLEMIHIIWKLLFSILFYTIIIIKITTTIII